MTQRKYQIIIDQICDFVINKLDYELDENDVGMLAHECEELAPLGEARTCEETDCLTTFILKTADVLLENWA